MNFETKLEKQNKNLLNIKSLISGSPYEESSLLWTSPQTRAQLLTTPSKQLRVEVSAPQTSHVSVVQWPENDYSLDSKTSFGEKYLNIIGKHSLKMSLVSLKSHAFDASGELTRDPDSPKSKFSVQSKYGNPWNHVTEVEWQRPTNQWRVDSQTERLNPNLNVVSIQGQYNHVTQPSTLNLKIGQQMALKASAQLYGQQKQIQIQAKNGKQFSHVTDVQFSPQDFQIKSRTDDSFGRNIAKIDSFLTPSIGK